MKKILSALLAVIMIFAMIPAISVSAASGEGWSYDEGTDTLTITTAAGWNSVADNAAYANSTIKLGADLDFSETSTDKPLFSTQAFGGKFDGQGYTIKNIVASALGGFIAKQTVDSSITDTTIDTSKYIEVKNLTIDGAQLSSSSSDFNSSFIIGTLNTYGRFENIKIMGDSYVANKLAYVGAIVGGMNEKSLIYVDNCSVTTTHNPSDGYGMIKGGRGAGGILGGIHFSSNDATKYTNATNVIKNCYVNSNVPDATADVIDATATGNGRAGGIVGYWAKGDSNNRACYNITVSNCYYTGKLVGKACAGSIFGSVGDCTVNINNSVFNVVSMSAPADYSALAVGYGYYYAKIVFSNVYCVSISNVTKICVNTKDVTGAPTTIDADTADALVIKDAENNVVAFAGNIVSKMFAQVSTVDANNQYIIRLVMPVMTGDVTNLKSAVVAKSAGEVLATYDYTCKKYDRLTNSLNGVDEVEGIDTYTPDEFGAEKLLACAITGVPAGTAYDFEITAEFTISNCTFNTLTYGASVDTSGVLQN